MLGLIDPLEHMSSSGRLEWIRDDVHVQYGGHWGEIHVYFIRRITIVFGESILSTLISSVQYLIVIHSINSGE